MTLRRTRTPLVSTALAAVLLASVVPAAGAGEDPRTAVTSGDDRSAVPTDPSGDVTAPDPVPDEDAARDLDPADDPAGGDPADAHPADAGPADDADGDRSGGAGTEGAPTDGTDPDAGEDVADDEAATSAHAAAAPPPGGFAIRGSVRAAGDPRPDLVFRGSGWGHGVGMSQYGAWNMARQGFDTPAILAHYYPGTTLESRAASAPIRVGLRQNLAAPWVRAVSGQVPWFACPAPTVPNQRTPDSACSPLLRTGAGAVLQPVGATYHVCQDGALQRVQTVACGQAGGETVATTPQPILRVRHDGIRIEAPGPNAARCGEERAAGVGCYGRGDHDIVNRSSGLWNTVQYVPSLQDYLYGLAEMPASWSSAALQAQAIAGRTYALRTMQTRGYRATCNCDLLATPSDQAYGGHQTETAQSGAWRRAVDATFAAGAGQVVTYQGALAQMFYASAHGGGRSESIQDSWSYGNEAIPYLQSVADPYSMDQPHDFRAWTSRATHTNFAAHVSSGQSTAVARVERVQILSRTPGGTPRELRVSGVTAGGQATSFVFTHRSADSQVLQAKRVAGASLRANLPTSGNASVAGARMPSSQIQNIGFPPFLDDDGTTHEYAITWAHAAGVASGTTSTTFRPGDAVTRAQMATFIYNTFAVPAPTQRGRFSDVSNPNATHALAIDALAQAGVTDGFADGTYRPGESVTRAQMATFLQRAAGLNAPAGNPRPFTDVHPDRTHGQAIAAVAEAGIAAGCSTDGTRYCPGDPVLRGQMATFLRRAATR